MKKIIMNVILMFICIFMLITTLFAWRVTDIPSKSNGANGSTNYEGVEFDVEGAEGSETTSFKPGDIIALRYNITGSDATKKYYLNLNSAKVTYPLKERYDNFVYNTGQYYNLSTNKKYSGELGEDNFLRFVNPVTNSFKLLFYSSSSQLSLEALKEKLKAGDDSDDEISIFNLDTRENGLTQDDYSYSEGKECRISFGLTESKKYGFEQGSTNNYIGVLVYFDPNVSSNAYVNENDKDILVVQKNTNAFLFQSVLLEYHLTEE